jgi:hypothetical protein
MDKLRQLLTANRSDFAAAFGAATRGMAEAAAVEGSALWMEGWTVPARAGCVLGEGDLIYQGRPARFHFSGLPFGVGEGMRVHAIGTVTGLRRLSDFSGTYLLCGPSPAPNAGGSRKRLRNENGVVIHLTDLEDLRPFNAPQGRLHVRLATDL